MRAGQEKTAKNLQVRLAQLRADREEQKRRRKAAEVMEAKLSRAIKNAERDLDRLHNYGPSVSEHAKVRYLERVAGISMDKVEEHILTPGIRAAIETLGDTKRLPHPEGFVMVVKNKNVVTIKGQGDGEDED